MNLPNALTLLRIFFVPLLVAVLVQKNLQFEINGIVVTNEFIALLIFLIGALDQPYRGEVMRCSGWG